MLLTFLIVELIVIIGLIGVYEVIMLSERSKHREEVHDILAKAEQERRDLYSRIQSRDLADYMTHTTHKERTVRKPNNFLQQAKTDAYREMEE